MMFAALFPNVRALAPAALLAFAAGCAPAPVEPEEVTYPEAPQTVLMSDKNAVQIEVRTAPYQPPVRGRSYVELLITDGEGQPVPDLSISVVPFMPDMAHAAGTDPDVTDEGDGHYEIAPVDMIMSGRWELLTTLNGQVKDSASIGFDIE